VRWVTRQGLHVDRTASGWLIRTRIDPAAEFAFVPSGTDPAAVDGRTFDMRGADFGHEGTRCTFETLVHRFDLAGDPALAEMGRIIRDADVPPSRTRRPEAAGLAALLSGFRLAVADDLEKLRLTAPVYDALYAYCRAEVAARPPAPQTPRPRLRYGRRVAAHLEADEA
jgi:hypothetical protein